MARKDAIIRCFLRYTDKQMEELRADEDAWFRAWGQVQYYLENIERVKFT